MNQDQFLQMLKNSGYPDPVEIEQAPDGRLGEHTHPFAVQALVIEGSIEIRTRGNTEIFRVGDVFRLDLEQAHSESYGSQGVKYLASRKE